MHWQTTFMFFFVEMTNLNMNRLDSPKSASLSSPRSFISRFCGFRSRWRTFLRWQYDKPRSNCKRKSWGEKKQSSSQMGNGKLDEQKINWGTESWGEMICDQQHQWIRNDWKRSFLTLTLWTWITFPQSSRYCFRSLSWNTQQTHTFTRHFTLDTLSIVCACIWHVCISPGTQTPMWGTSACGWCHGVWQCWRVSDLSTETLKEITQVKWVLSWQ